MKKDNKFLKWLKRPRGFFLALIYIAALAAVAGSVALAAIGTTPAFAGVLFGLAAVLLAYSVYTVVVCAPAVKRTIIIRLKSHKFSANILENYGFKTAVFALVSFAACAVIIAMAGVMLMSCGKNLRRVNNER